MNLFKVLIDGLVGILFFIDNIVYSFIPILYRMILYLANVDLITGNVPVQALIQRIYILVGVFMLFRLSFSILNYIINPDAFSDQSKGFSNLVRRVLIAVVLLVGIPWFFREAYVIQNKIITSGILPRLILGESIDYSENNGNNELEDSINTSARDVQFMLFGPFFGLNYESESGDLVDCTPSPDYPTSNIFGTNGMAANEACMETVAGLMDESSDVQASGATLRDFFRYEDDTTHKIIDRRKFDEFGGLVSWTLSNGDRAIKYYPILSTLCGGYLVFLLLSFCIDIGARVIRLFFLQILSPIAVISSIDPTSSGDRLKDWAKECVKVWASLFLRLLVIFLIIQLVRVISNSIYSGTIFSTGYSNSSALNAWIYVFLILGVFQAAKSIPELIEKATGIKMSGDLQLNPFKALRENAGVGLGLAGLGIGATAIGSGLVNTIASGVERYRDQMDDENGLRGGALARSVAGRMFTSGIGGFFGGASRSIIGAARGEKVGKNMRNSFGAAMFARQQREDLHRQGVNGFDILRSDIDRNLGIFTQAQREQMRISGQERQIQLAERALQGDEQALQRLKAEHERNMSDATRPYETYQGYLQQMEQRINNDAGVDSATKALTNAQATGDEDKIKAAVSDLRRAKQDAFMNYVTSDDGRAMRNRIDALRSQYAELQDSQFDYYTQDENGVDGFNGQAIKDLDGAMYEVRQGFAAESEYLRQVEQGELADAQYALSVEKARLEERKTADDFERHKLADKQQRVTGPQPDGWDPSWGYGPTGQGVFYGQGQNGHVPPPPGNPPRNP